MTKGQKDKVVELVGKVLGGLDRGRQVSAELREAHVYHRENVTADTFTACVSLEIIERKLTLLMMSFERDLRAMVDPIPPDLRWSQPPPTRTP